MKSINAKTQIERNAKIIYPVREIEIVNIR
jgi:hypothetical protein